MRTITITIAAILTISASAFGKTKNITANQYELVVNKIDSSIVGTWEKSWNLEQKSKEEFCQFNANGTFISFKKTADKYVVTGRGNWSVEKGMMTIFHGNEKASTVKYESTGNYLSFESNVSYAKPAQMYVNK